MQGFPQIRMMGLTGLLVRFSNHLSDPANRAALAYRAAIEAAGWEGVVESSTALASAYLRLDPLAVDPRDIAERAATLATSRDWLTAPLPQARRLWRIPCAWHGPDLADAAACAGYGAAEARAILSAAQTRVLALGFAPGQPYLGQLGQDWDVPRQAALQTVPAGAVLLAVRQLVLFTAPGPTGWRHVGQTAFLPFQPDADVPIPLRPGDEVRFDPVTAAEIEALRAQGPMGGAVAEPLP